MERNLYINELDHKRLMRLIEDALNGITEQSNSLRSLQVELGQATVVNAEELPRDVVTMRSRVLIMLDDEEKETTLVYPNEANHSTGKISILSPIGTAIIPQQETINLAASIFVFLRCSASLILRYSPLSTLCVLYG